MLITPTGADRPIRRARWAWALGMLLGLLAASGRAAAPPTLLVLGDSLSAGYGIRVADGWVALLARRLAATDYGYQVVNASVSGETSLGGEERLAHLLTVHRPAVLILELGANDGLRGLPPAEIEANLGRIIDSAQGEGATVLLIGMRLPENYGPEYTERFAAVFPALSQRLHVALVPFLLEPVAGDLRAFQADGLHPTAAVQPKILEHVWTTLRPLLAARRHRPVG